MKTEPFVDVEETLLAFGQKCVEFGYYCDQYMREEINLGEITRRLAEATSEVEAFYSAQHHLMNADQIQRYDVMHKTLEAMTTSLIETEIERNQKIITDALANGEYFIVNLSFNSISSSIYMVYSNPNEEQKRDLRQRLDALQKEQEMAGALMKLLKAIETRLEPESLHCGDLEKLQKVLQLYNQYFDSIKDTPLKQASNQRVFKQFKKHIAFLQGKAFFNNQHKIFAHLSACVITLKLMDTHNATMHRQLDDLKEMVRPPDPTKILAELYQNTINATGETNVYSAVIEFNNFADAHPSELKIAEFKRDIRKHLKSQGYL